MHGPPAAFLVHTKKVTLAALLMLGIGALLWVVLGAVTSLLDLWRFFGFTSAALYVACISLLPVLIGAYLSARRIAPNSVLHPVLAGVTLAILFVWIFTRGDVGALKFELIVAAATAAAIGAVLGRRPPNNRSNGPGNA